jgi:SAM-dependent methyltransferase
MVAFSDDKQQVYDFWNSAACGEHLYLATPDRQGYVDQSLIRYRLEPFIEQFAAFDSTRGLKVLEIGVGLGADHQRFAEAGADLYGIDLTPRAVEFVRQRLAVMGLSSQLQIGDAENLEFPDDTFDLVYSWGVIHHSPDTARAAREILRVLKPGGIFRVMVYHRRSIVGLMLWMRYALLRGRPLTPLGEIYARHLESPGTKAYSIDEARALFAAAGEVGVRAVLTHGDLLTSDAGQRHRGVPLDLARRVWPRALIRKVLPGWGLFLLIEGRKQRPPYATDVVDNSRRQGR